jgi:hypothetical protein
MTPSQAFVSPRRAGSSSEPSLAAVGRFDVKRAFTRPGNVSDLAQPCSSPERVSNSGGASAPPLFILRPHKRLQHDERCNRPYVPHRSVRLVLQHGEASVCVRTTHERACPCLPDRTTEKVAA